MIVTTMYIEQFFATDRVSCWTGIKCMYKVVLIYLYKLYVCNCTCLHTYWNHHLLWYAFHSADKLYELQIKGNVPNINNKSIKMLLKDWQPLTYMYLEHSLKKYISSLTEPSVLLLYIHQYWIEKNVCSFRLHTCM